LGESFTILIGSINASTCSIMSYPDLPLRVVCASKKTRDEFFSETPTGKSLLRFSDVTPAEVILHTENSTGLSELYNTAIEEALYSPCILVFMHDDIEILDFFWGERIKQGLKNFDVVGLAGTGTRVPLQPSWRFTRFDGEKFIDDAPHSLSGVVGHYDTSNEKSAISIYGSIGKRCELMDGLFFAVESTKLIASGTRFDPIFTFHFYDMDFCRSVQKNKLIMGTIALSVLHHSGGAFDTEWKSAYERYIEKWDH